LICTIFRKQLADCSRTLTLRQKEKCGDGHVHLLLSQMIDTCSLYQPQ